MAALNAYHQYRTTERGSVFAAWDGVVEALQDLGDDLARSEADELRRERSALRDVLRLDCVQLHVSLRSPDLYDGISRLLEEDPRAGCAVIPKDERHFLDLAYRAMYRTSPLGRLTAVTIGLASERGLAAEDGPVGSLCSPSSLITSTPLVVSARVYADLSARSIDASSGGDVSSALTLNPSLRLAAERVVFVRSVAGAAERVPVRVTPLLDHVVQLVQNVSLTRTELADELAARFYDGNSEASTAFVESMIRERLLVTSLPGPTIFGENRLDTFPVSALDTSIEDLATSEPHRRRVRVEGIKSDLRRRLAREGVVTEPVLYEDLGGVAAFGSVEPLRRAIAPGLRLLAAFDTNLDLALISTDVFHRRFGNSTQNLIDCGVALNRETRASYEHFLQRPSLDVAEQLGLRRFAQLVRARAEVTDAVDAMWENKTLDFDIRSDQLAALNDSLIESGTSRSPRAYSVFAQGQGGDWVVNDALGGGGALWARYLPSPDAGRSGSDLWDYLRKEAASRKMESVQDTSLHGVSISNSPLISPRSARWEDWRGISVHLDPASGGLLRFNSAFSDRDVPDYLGAGAPWLLGPFTGLLHWHRAGGRLGASRLLLDAYGESAPGCGRLRMNGIIFHRRSWSVPELSVKLGNAMTRSFVEMFDFWVDEGLPFQGFFKHRDGGRGAKRAKPVYFDASSVASMVTLGRRLGELERYGLLQEAFPVPVDGERAMEIMLNAKV
ncbi:hypothetical protein C5D07_08540 [Rathayibacter tritici]|uniref:lantibiotic dehydratase n=2 Tax=Rathayibacter tritici TaxID=33888 RepID=UPI000CE9332A|nr:lantibiotic dehydratase [Rathayibacter tritici]PPF31552.1 hypothetical protein C5C06_02045 [Rathayibacter tritici]PPI14105.1 hypothetical protein C5D07_08540 [Rathayibacter tritici]